jgi:hypothetical protein
MMITKETNTVTQESLVRAPATSFIVRVWSSAGGESDVRGEIEHLATGEKRFFPDYRALLRLIESWRKDTQPEP